MKDYKKNGKDFHDKVEIPSGAIDSELDVFEYTIPEGAEAEIKDGKVIIKKSESEDEKIRKWLYKVVNDCDYLGQIPCDRKQVLAWLEKKSERKDSYTKQQLRDMGFAFTLNDDIVTPEETNEAIKEYIANEKKKWEAEQKPVEWNKEDEEIWKELIKIVCTTSYLDQYTPSFELREKMLDWLEKQSKSNPYGGVSFKYNGHTWGMCARDNGVDIMLDKQLFKHLEKQSEQKQKHEQWKPTEEQLKVLYHVVKYYISCLDKSGTYSVMKSLYEELKAL